MAQDSTEDTTLNSIKAKIAARVDRSYTWAEITTWAGRHLVHNPVFYQWSRKASSLSIDAQQAHRLHWGVEEILRKVQALGFEIGDGYGKMAPNRPTRQTAPIESMYAPLAIRMPSIL